MGNLQREQKKQSLPVVTVKTIYTPAYEKLVAKLRRQRLRLGMRQGDVGHRMGVSRHWVAKVERGLQRMDVVQFVRFFKVLHIHSSQLIRWLEEGPSEEAALFFTCQTSSRLASSNPPKCNKKVEKLLFPLWR